jgi:hypothetical protein
VKLQRFVAWPEVLRAAISSALKVSFSAKKVRISFIGVGDANVNRRGSSRDRPAVDRALGDGPSEVDGI